MDQNQRNADRTAMLRKLGEQVEQLTESDEWRRWLDVASRFHTYSFGNQMLIMSQRPDATRVAGYRTWQSMGRQVRKGERGIRIFAPMVVKDRDDEDGTIVLFKVVSAFAYEQTDGDPLPEMEWPILATMPDDRLYDQLVAVAESMKLTVSTTSTSTNGARGWYLPTSRTITLVDTFPLASQARTLLHELSHSLDPGCHSCAPRRRRLSESWWRSLRPTWSESAWGLPWTSAARSTWRRGVVGLPSWSGSPAMCSTSPSGWRRPSSRS
jgi:hypothetical protein